MRGVRSTADGPAVVEVDEPTGDGLLLEVRSSSICGTDLGFLAMGPLPFTFGHEFAGVVDGVPYAVEPTLRCGTCTECLAGHTQRCVGEHGNLGIFIDGGLADRVRVPAENLVALPDGLDVADACLVEPAAVAWHGVVRATIQPGERVVVVGGGSIGLLAVAAARHPHQVSAGERLGAGRPSGQYDVVIEAAGGKDLAREAAAEPGRPAGAGIAGDWSCDLATRTGLVLHVRPANQQDEALLAEFFSHVTPEDLRFRFLGGVRQVSHDRLVAMTQLDHKSAENFLAFADDGKPIVATAMVACDASTKKAEVAISVRSDYKHKGVAWELLRHVARFAAAMGVETLESIESRENHEAIELEQEQGFVATTYEDDPTLMVIRKELRG